MADMNIPEISKIQFQRMIPREQRLRLTSGNFISGDILALRKYLRLTQKQFAFCLGISSRTLQNWEQDRSHPEGPSKVLIKIFTRHPRLILEDIRNVS